MKRDFESLSVDELWALYEKVSEHLAVRLIEKMDVLEARLKQLAPRLNVDDGKSRRRPYPKVQPKFQNPDQQSQTLTG